MKVQTKCIFILSVFVIHPQILTLSVFKIAEFFPILIANTIFHVTVHLLVYISHLRSICGTENSSQQTSQQCLSTIDMVFSDEDEILIKTHTYTQHT